MNPERVMQVGQYLGSENRIARMTHFKYGWKMRDSTGEEYKQPDFPEGMRTSDIAESCVDKPRTPWPAAPEVS